MTIEEIKSLITNNISSYDFQLYSKAFKSNLTQCIYIPVVDWNTGQREENPNLLITPYITECVNSFLSLNLEDFIDELKNELFRLFNICIEVTSYGQVPDALIDQYGNTEANRIFFDGMDRDSVYKNCRFDRVFYDCNNEPDIRFSISVGIDWDLEHGLTMYFENGHFLSVEE